MAVNWPIALPDCPQTWREVDISQLIRSDVDVGVSKVRRRYTRERSRISTSLTLVKADYNEFKQFYNVTLKDGLESFTYKHPYTGQLIECRFIEAPLISMVARAFEVAMEWETL